MSRIDYSTLPSCDEHGSFWLAQKPRRLPAVFQISSVKNPDLGRWYPVPADGDVPFEEGRILCFDTPEEALAWLRRNARGDR